MIKDERKNKTELYIIVENSCSECIEDMQTWIFDNEEDARSRFESLIADDKAFLEEEGYDDIIERDGDCYQSYPEGDYAERHYTLDLLVIKHNKEA